MPNPSRLDFVVFLASVHLLPLFQQFCSFYRSSMPRPHPLALFSLLPVCGNERAERPVSHPDNIHHVSTLSSGVEALDVGFHIRGKSSKTLATLGRGIDADIYVEGSSTAKIQCSFEIDLDTGVVMLYDRSFAKSTQVSGKMPRRSIMNGMSAKFSSRRISTL